MAVRPVLAAIAAASFFLGTAAASAQPLPRSTTDRPDDLQGPQVHFIYAVPSDQPDRSFDVDGTIDGSISAIQSWLRGQTGGQGLKIDMSNGEPDITFVQLPQTDAAYAASGDPLDPVLRDLVSANLLKPNRLYAIYYEGSAPSPVPNEFLCGLGGSLGPLGVAMIILHDNCGYDLNGSKAGITGNLEFVVLHEILHGMGLVQDCAPHTTHDGHVSDDPHDLMSPILPPAPVTLDAAHDDYFHANIAGCLDLSESRFLEGAGWTLTLAVSSQAGGTGAVQASTGDPPEVDLTCPPACTDTYDAVTPVQVTLDAVAAPDSVFLGWQGICSGTSLRCSTQLSASGQAVAVFGKKPVTLTAAVTGKGRVASTPAGISCPGHCTATFAYGTKVRLKASLLPGWTFAGWTGACNGRVPCFVRLTQAAGVRATFRKS